MSHKLSEILLKKELSHDITQLDIYSPLIAKKARAGQFIILCAKDDSERIPLTIADTDEKAGSITLIFQKIGKSTMILGELNEGECLSALAGPLGLPSHLEGLKKVAVIGGGLGCAIAYPTAKALFAQGTHVDLIAGFRTRELVIIEDMMKGASTNLHMCTDDGSCGYKGFVTDKLEQLINEGNQYDEVFAIGPLVMMKFVSRLTKKYGIKTTVSLNPLMVDGTGMCGCCRVTVGGETKFACVDGPDFDGHLVDFDEIIARNNTYKEFEVRSKRDHECRLGGALHG